MRDPLQPTYWTADMVRALPEDGNRYEVVRGELLVTPSPRLIHQLIVGRLGHALAAYLERQPVGQVFQAPADISWDDETLVQPDVFVVPLDQARSMEWGGIRDLLLVAEVLSPSSARQDRFTKRLRYQEAGTPLYWIVDPEARQVEVWGPRASTPELERERLEWNPAGASEPFRLRLADLFRPV